MSYSHRDASSYLDEGSLLGFLKGLEKEGVEFWTDQHLVVGESWDEVIKRRIAESDIALVLVSQAFLDSEYCTNTEIQGFLARSAVLFPVILSACEWERHEWLKSRQFLPSGRETIEEHYVEPGRRKSLFLKIREQLREQIERVRAARRPPANPGIPPNPFGQTLAIKDPAMFIGRQAELRRLRTFLSGGSVSLQGEPKIGKSSLLWALARSWSGEIVGPLDFQGYDDLEDFYSDLAERLGLDSPRWRALRNHLRERAVLLLLDELDAGPGRGFDGEALARFRSLGNQNPGFKIVAASRNPLRQLFPDSCKDSPGYNFLPPLTLGELLPDEARRLLEHPWTGGAPVFDESCVAEILALAGQHPFKLQRAAFHRYEVFVDPSYSCGGCLAPGDGAPSVSEKVDPVPILDLAPKRKIPLALWNPFDYLTLLYWAFFFPQAIRWYIGRFGDPRYKDVVGRLSIWEFVQDDRVQRSLAIQGLVMPFLFGSGVALALQICGLKISWEGVTGGVALGIAGGVLGGGEGAAGGIAGGVVGGVVGGAAFGLAGVPAFVVAFGVAFSVAFGVAAGVAGGVVFDVAAHVALGVSLGLVAGIVAGFRIGVDAGVIVGVAVAGIVGVVVTIFLLILTSRFLDWILSLPARLFGVHPLPSRVVWLPLPGSRERLVHWLDRDWVLGVKNANQILAFSLQFIPVVGAINDVLARSRPGDLLWRLVALAEEPYDWKLLRFGSASLSKELLLEAIENAALIPSRWRWSWRMKHPAEIENLEALAG